MKTRKLRIKVLISFLVIIATFALSVAVSGRYIIKKNIIEQAQTKVKNDLNSAREIYQRQTENVRNVVRFTALRFFVKDSISAGDKETLAEELDKVRKAESLDVLSLTDASGNVLVRSRNPSISSDSQAEDKLVSSVLLSREAIAGTVIVSRQELMKEGSDLAKRAHIKLIPTPKAKPSRQTEETSGMMIKAAAPVFGYDGALLGVLYGGSLLNRDYRIVDKVKETVYKGDKYKGKDTGRATIFQGDLRISTNVRTKDGMRAIGTRVSEEVYEQVLVKGLPWVDRAFVVTEWYKTAYEPIRDVNGQVVGILYVGILERPFVDMVRNIFLVYLAIVGIATLLAGLLAFVVAGAISSPLNRMVAATKRLSEGSLGHTVDAETGTEELNILAVSFNEMSAQLREREQGLKISNEKLEALNKTYLDLVGFVSHELKGILATAIMNAAAVRDGFFGAINPVQKKALVAVTGTLDYLRQTVRKFLDLSRIEKGELELDRTELCLREEVFDVCLETFATEIAEKHMQLDNSIGPQIKVNADLDLLHIVANNLIGNAVKYGLDGGKLVLKSKDLADQVRIEIYNDSTPIGQDDKAKLFKRFSRLDVPEQKKIKGTGLGLFITREIIEKHGGRIWVEPRENGNSFIFEIEKGF